ncbi:hypothetical protein Tco_1557082 [Tanacetum coccineum]
MPMVDGDHSSHKDDEANFLKLIFNAMETEVPHLSSPPHTNVADEAASIGVDVRHEGAATTVTSLDAG